MRYVSTRNKNHTVLSYQAIIDGISPDGGLYVPEELPRVSREELKKLMAMSYQDKAVFILKAFLPEFSEDELRECVESSEKRFDDNIIAPLVKIDDSTYALELWHGPTHAFKDVALTILPKLLLQAKQKAGIKENILILTATSGDTGKAALEGFKNIEGVKVAVLYPTDNVSEHQKLQMMIQDGGNVLPLGIKGDFDDAQTTVKKIFCDSDSTQKFKDAGYLLSSANSINWGRLLPQIVYYFSAYLDLWAVGEIQEGETINFVVPSGNFGNILAGYYAKQMGLPINKLICASNSNNVLTDFLTTGKYNACRVLRKTISPSMDILISSNTERLIFEISERNDDLTSKRMQELFKTGEYVLTDAELENIKNIFYADYADDIQTKETLNNIFFEKDYLCDPHTAVAFAVYNSYLFSEDDQTKTVIVSTASPYKFASDVLDALGYSVPENDHKSVLKLQAKTGVKAPEAIIKAFEKPILHDEVVQKEQVLQRLLDFVKN
ncbi:MAG TPA: threonine synthase [Clostridia bacterium]